MLNINLNWGLSSAGEHMTEDHGVPGSTPGGPIFLSQQKIYKMKRHYEYEMRMNQSELKEANAYILSIIGLVLALFIPFSALIVSIFKNPQTSTLIVSLGIPLAALVLGILALVKSIKYQTRLAKISKILSVITIIVGLILVIFNVYIFINSI